MDLKTLTRTKTFTRMLYGIGIFVVALLIFQAGVFVGFHKATFSFGGGDRYYRAFGEHQEGMRMPSMFGDDLSGAHGAIGKILKIEFPLIVVETPDHVEKVVRLDDETEFRSFRTKAKREDLMLGMYVVAIGSPNDNAEIAARLVRIIPPPPTENISPLTATTPASTSTPH